MKIVMTLLVRNEEDTLAANIDFHRSQGVDFFIITDNLSEDGTADIAQRYVRQGLAAYIHESGDDYSQAEWVTRMARLAATDHGAEWVVNSDADEFWTSKHAHRTLRDELLATPPTVEVLSARRQDFVPVPMGQGDFFAEKMLYKKRHAVNFLGKRLPAKACHRADPAIEVAQGNHAVGRNSKKIAAVAAPLRILHYPMRTYTQFELKIRYGGAAYARNTRLGQSVGATWRKMYALLQQGGLEAFYASQVAPPQAIEEQLRDGSLIFDDTLPRTLARRA